jgi:hypothetical protein
MNQLLQWFRSIFSTEQAEPDAETSKLEKLLQDVWAFRDAHGERADMLVDTTEGTLFPCDALTFTVLERSLNLIRSFNLLLSNGCYTTGMGVMRMQMDNVLRYFGALQSGNPHDVALQMYYGTALRNIKDASNKKMTDARLVELLAVNNPWVTHVYDLASGYIHLSNNHFHHFLIRSPKGSDGIREFTIGDEDAHIPIEAKEQLIKAFGVLTNAVLSLTDKWIAERHNLGSVEELKAQYTYSV